MKYYTGVGSRETPSDILTIIQLLASYLAKQNYILRSGGAIAADAAFEKGCDLAHGQKEIFYANDATPETLRLASQIHPAWHRCSEYAKKLHARNCFQVLGKDLKTPSEFLICWTKDGRHIGGTRTAIKLALNNHIPIINLGIKEDREAVLVKLNRKIE